MQRAEIVYADRFCRNLFIRLHLRSVLSRRFDFATIHSLRWLNPDLFRVAPSSNLVNVVIADVYPEPVHVFRIICEAPRK